MAKAKKSEGRKAETPKKAPAKKSAKSKPSAALDAPLIDTSLAAENAAKMLMAGLSKPQPAAGGTGAKQESAMFKQLKAGLKKPAATTMSNLLGKQHGPELTKSHANMKQVGHNQTFGADVTRSGVPRRTPG